MADKKQNGKNVGSIVEIKGVVLDAVFPARLPEINTALSIAVTDRDDGSTELIAEVQQHLGDDRVRAVAMDTTDGLPRGAEIVDTGQPISGPVGDVRSEERRVGKECRSGRTTNHRSRRRS